MSLTVTDGVMTLAPPPPGYQVDFDNPPRYYVTTSYVVIGIGMALAVLFTAQRIYVRAVLHRAFGLDDVLVIISLLFAAAEQGLVVKGMVDRYFGVHIWELSIDKFETFTKFGMYIQPIVFVPPTMLTKLVILVFYLRLQNRRRWYNWSIYATMFYVVGSNLGVLFGIIFTCNPIDKAWRLDVQGGSCIDRVALFKATAGFGVSSDILIILIPMPMIWKLQMSTAKKVGLAVIFAIGSVTFVTSIVRLKLLIDFLDEPDVTWGAGEIMLWICIESNLLVICSCLPTLRAFVRSVAPRLVSSSIDKPARYAYGNSSATQSQPHGRNRGGPNPQELAIGSRLGTRQKGYVDFDGDEEYRMETLIQGGKDGPSRRHSQTQSQSDLERGDDSSERGIIQKKEVIITYEESRG